MHFVRAILPALVLVVPCGCLTAQEANISVSLPAPTRIHRVPDSGQRTDYTPTFGEDSDYEIASPSFEIRDDGTVLDRRTGLIWQRTDGGEMTVDAALAYCDTLTLAGYSDWRLPEGRELFSILNHDRVNPAVDTAVFTRTGAEYWWSNERRADDSSRVWVVNAGGGIGPHPRNETVSAGGTKRIHVRAVRDSMPARFAPERFIDNGNGTVTDGSSGLMWQQTAATEPVAWDSALARCEGLELAGYLDWRLPNVKELQSLNDAFRTNPSVDPGSFPSVRSETLWSSTTQYGATGRAWTLDGRYGIVSYAEKTRQYRALAVRGDGSAADSVCSVNEQGRAAWGHTFQHDQSVPQLRSVTQSYDGAVLIRWTTPVATTVRVSLFDPLGNELVRLVDAYVGAGEHHVEGRAGSVARGPIFVRLAAATGASVQRLLLMN